MAFNIGISPGLLAQVAMTSFLALGADAAEAQSVSGTATYRERIALPPGAIFEATLEDVWRADAPSETIALTRVASPGSPPIAFTLAYDRGRILDDHRYVVRARILLDTRLLFATDTAVPVITRGSPTDVSLMLVRAGGGQAVPPAASRSTPLEGTYWKAIELAEKPTPPQDQAREAHLLFQAGGRLSGSDGCNRLTGSYQLKGDIVSFGQMAATQMACINAGETEGPARDALKSAARLTIVGDRLELLDSTNRRVAVFAAGPQTPPPSASLGLAGTSWQLVRFQGSDDTTLTPDDRAKYAIEFGADGRLTARIDCNRGFGTWKSGGANQLQFGPLALTRARCPAGSLHDQIVKQWINIRSFVTRDGHLFLALMSDGGIYEFEPVAKKP